MNRNRNSAGRFLLAGSAIALITLTLGCSDQDSENERPGSVVRSVAPSTLEGVWENRGYGRILNIGSSTVSDFQVTDDSCLLSAEVFPHELDALLSEVELASGGREFNTKPELIAEHVHAYTFSQLDSLPEDCDEANIVRSTADPAVNYDVLWATFNEYYAFFNVRGVDWDEVNARFRPAVGQVVTDEELFNVFREMLQPLGDGHVDLIIEGAGVYWDAGVPPSWWNRVVDYFESTHPEEQLQQDFENQADFDEYDEFINAVFAQYIQELSVKHDEILEGYLGVQVCAANNHVCWGVTSDNVGYLSIDAMQGFSPDTSEEGTEYDLDAVRLVMDEAFLTLTETEALIVDVRQNQGGQDSVSHEIAGRFSDQNRFVYHKESRNGDEVANQHDIFVNSTGESAYTKPVYLLTSGGTYSAADVFALIMKGLPNVTLVGEPSGGIFSDAIAKKLPNGWTFTLSTEIYSDPEGNVYEGVGVPVDHFIDYFVPQDILAGHDLAIEMALSLNASSL